jgi:hypothetical protein
VNYNSPTSIIWEFYEFIGVYDPRLTVDGSNQSVAFVDIQRLRAELAPVLI